MAPNPVDNSRRQINQIGGGAGGGATAYRRTEPQNPIKPVTMPGTMPIVLYDLAGAADRRFSSNCWRTRFAVAHKGLACTTRATRFTDIARIADGAQPTVPVIDDGGRIVGDSWRIAAYLEATYPTPSLFGHPAGRALALHLQTWLPAALSPLLMKLIILDLAAAVDPADRNYFRQSREKRLGMTLETFADGARPAKVDAVLAALAPIRSIVESQKFLGGDAPLYPDYLVAAALMWPRAISPGPLLPADDAVTIWFSRMLDQHNGLARAAFTAWDGP